MIDKIIIIVIIFPKKLHFKQRSCSTVKIISNSLCKTKEIRTKWNRGGWFSFSFKTDK